MYTHSTPLNQSSNLHQFHPLSLSFNGLKNVSNVEKTTPLYSPVTDEGYSSVGSSSTPISLSNNPLTTEIFNHYKDYIHPGCMHNSSNQREKLEIVALELLNQARLIPNHPCFSHSLNKDILMKSDENKRAYMHTVYSQHPEGYNDKCNLLSQSDMRLGSHNYTSLTKSLASITPNISQNEQMKCYKQHENILKMTTDNHTVASTAATTTNVDVDIDCNQSVERRTRICNQILGQVRREMIKLIDNSMQQLETYLQNQHFEKNLQNSPNLLGYCNSQSTCLQDLIDVTPLDLKFNKTTNNTELMSNNSGRYCQNLYNKSHDNLVSSTYETLSTTELQPMSSKTRPLRLSNKTRRLRIHQLNSQLFANRSQTKKLNRLSPGQTNKRQISDDSKESQSKIPHLNESLDLRIHHDDRDDQNQPARIVLSNSPQSNHLNTRLKRSMIGSQNKTTTLSAVHLKKAKMMFMYSRYPTSSLLKSYFPEVIFNRGSTAQLVKWFSNFREFFYIQIEKFVRQQKANGLKKVDDIVLPREHELIRSMEIHFNKGDEIETPNEFLKAIQITVWEFADAILNEHDINSSWKKAIYKKISTLDIQFPEFFRC
ncbi:unnamed protein product [Heterobilharzia americana]|nr:unnamed protein product [Heterobilharzia americana]